MRQSLGTSACACVGASIVSTSTFQMCLTVDHFGFPWSQVGLFGIYCTSTCSMKTFIQKQSIPILCKLIESASVLGWGKGEIDLGT